MAEKMLNTRIQLKYDSWANWSSTTLGDNKGANMVLKKGEIGICSIPSGINNAGVQNPPHIMFKVGDGTSAFSALEWTSAKAADVYAWAKQAALPVTKVGDGNVVSGIEWDAESKGIKFTTASVATSEGLENLTNRVKTIEDTYATDNDLAAAVETINAAIALKADKTYVDEELAKKVNVSDFNTFKGENTTAIGTAKSEAIAASKTETETQVNALRDGAVKNNADAISAIKDHASVDSFADVMTEMAKYQLSGDYATKTEAQGYANAKDEAIAAAKASGDKAQEDLGAYITSNNAAVALKAAQSDLDNEVQRATNAEAGLAQRIGVLEGHDHTSYELKTDAAQKLVDAKAYADEKAGAVQDEVDNLETLVGQLPEGTTATSVVDYINKKTEGIATDAALGELNSQVAGLQTTVQTINGDYLKAADKTELNNAIAAEAERADAAEKANAAAIKAISDDYLKAEHKTALENAIALKADAAALAQEVSDREAAVSGLQTQINTIMSNPDAEGVINSINEFTQYVKDHGEIAEGFRTDINKNKDDIAAEVKRASDEEARIVGLIQDLDDETYSKTEINERIDSLDTDIADLAGIVGGKADKATTLAGYGITDAYTKSQVDNEINGVNAEINDINSLMQDMDEAKADKATTLAGYGIADAYTKSEMDTALAGKATAAQGALADSALQEVTAGTGLKVTDKKNVEFDDSVVFIFNCGDSQTVL